MGSRLGFDIPNLSFMGFVCGGFDTRSVLETAGDMGRSHSPFWVRFPLSPHLSASRIKYHNDWYFIRESLMILWLGKEIKVKIFTNCRFWDDTEVPGWSDHVTRYGEIFGIRIINRKNSLVSEYFWGRLSFGNHKDCRMTSFKDLFVWSGFRDLGVMLLNFLILETLPGVMCYRNTLVLRQRWFGKMYYFGGRFKKRLETDTWFTYPKKVKKAEV